MLHIALCDDNPASIALFVTYNGVNTACWFVMNQDELPKGSKKLRNF